MICRKTATTKGKPVMHGQVWDGGAVPPSPPATPARFAVQSQTDASVTVAWDAAPGGVRIHLQWQQAGGDWNTLIGDLTDTPPPPMNVMMPNFNADYDLRIRAENDAGTSDWATLSGVYTRPAVPTGLAAVPGGYGLVELSWDGFDDANMTYTLLKNGVSYSTSLTGTGFEYTSTGPGTTTEFSLVAVGNLSGLSGIPCSGVSGTSGTGTAPHNTRAPVITDMITGANVTDNGDWSGDPMSLNFSYQWFGNGILIPSATDIGIGYTEEMTLYECVVTATNAVGSAAMGSNDISGTIPV